MIFNADVCVLVGWIPDNVCVVLLVMGFSALFPCFQKLCCFFYFFSVFKGHVDD